MFGLNLNQFDVGAVFEIETAIFRDEGNEKGEGAGRDGDAKLLGLAFILRSGELRKNADHCKKRHDHGAKKSRPAFHNSLYVCAIRRDCKCERAAALAICSLFC